jgi:two-component system nitrate/nitrite response regulator NarL
MERFSKRILVVDDSEPFRKFVCSGLKAIPNLQIVGEATDGLEAVRKAQQLKPDLILLDIGLPSLNGIEAARQIRKLSPQSKILFGSQECSVDVVREALGTGAQGYFVKCDAGSELLESVNAVLRGEHFVGKRFASHHFSDEWDGDSDAQDAAPRRDRIESNPIPARLQ